MWKYIHRQTFSWLSLSLVSSRTFRALLWVPSLSVWSLNDRCVELRNFRRWLLWVGLRNWACSEIKHWISNVTSSNLTSLSRLLSVSWRKIWKRGKVSFCSSCRYWMFLNHIYFNIPCSVESNVSRCPHHMFSSPCHTSQSCFWWSPLVHQDN